MNSIQFGASVASRIIAIVQVTSLVALAQATPPDEPPPAASLTTPAPVGGNRSARELMVRFLVRSIRASLDPSRDLPSRPEVEAYVRNFLVAAGRSAGEVEVGELSDAVLDEFGGQTPVSPILLSMRESPLREALTANWLAGDGRMALSDLKEKSEFSASA